MVFWPALYVHVGQMQQKLFLCYLSTFRVDKESPTELKHINDVTGQASAKQNRGDTLGADDWSLISFE